jgi:hypothetical protein
VRALPFHKGSPAASDAKTTPPVPSGTPSLPGSLVEVCSHRPRSLVVEQGGPSRMAPVVDMSSPQGEENPIHYITHDFEFTQCLFIELNRNFLGPPGDDKVIILSSSDEEEEEAHKENSIDAKDAAASTAINPVSAASAEDISTLAKKSLSPATSPADVDNDSRVAPKDSSDDLAPDLKVEEGTMVETKPAHLRLPHQERHLQQACFKESYIQHYYPSSSFARRSWDGDVGLWLTLMPFMPADYFCSFLDFRYVLDVELDST